MPQRERVIVRSAIADDMPAVAAIYGYHVTRDTASFELTAPTDTEMRSRCDAAIAANYPFLVAVDAAVEIVGYAYAGPYRSRPAYRYTVENSVYVARDRVGRGIGYALLAALIEACEARGFRQMIAIIGGADNVASIALHKRHGFVEAGRLSGVGRKFDRWLDTVLMQRSLGLGAALPPLRL